MTPEKHEEFDNNKTTSPKPERKPLTRKQQIVAIVAISPSFSEGLNS
jgi:hypothetical protein